MINPDFKRGVESAASIASSFNSTSTNEFDLGEVILCKLNVIKKKRPKKNTKRCEDPKDTLVQGMALALAEVHRLAGNTATVCEVARNAALSISILKKSGVDPYDWKELAKAGVKKK